MPWLPVAAVASWVGVLVFAGLVWLERPRVMVEIPFTAEMAVGVSADGSLNEALQGNARVSDPEGRKHWPQASREGWVVIPSLLVEQSLGDWSLVGSPVWGSDILEGLGLNESEMRRLNESVAHHYKIFTQQKAEAAQVITTDEETLVIEVPKLEKITKTFFSAVTADTARLLNGDKAAALAELIRLAEPQASGSREHRVTLKLGADAVTEVTERRPHPDPDEAAHGTWFLFEQRSTDLSQVQELRELSSRYWPYFHAHRHELTRFFGNEEE